MTFTPHGKHLIAGTWLGGEGTFRSEPAHGPAHDFAAGTVALVDQAARAAEDAFWSFGWSSRSERAALLRAIADEIDVRAAAMATLVVLTSMLACLLYHGVQIVVERYTQAWRRPSGMVGKGH